MAKYKCQTAITVHWTTDNSYEVGESGRRKLEDQMRARMTELGVAPDGEYATWSTAYEESFDEMTLGRVVEQIEKRVDGLPSNERLSIKLLDAAGQDEPKELAARVKYFYDLNGNCYHPATLYVGAEGSERPVGVNARVKNQETGEEHDIGGELAVMFTYREV
ncbi:MAG: hypothetical protein ACF8XB_15940 [Planctomycetota bacterium JB042]